MTEVTNEPMYEVLEQIQSDISLLKQGQTEMRMEMNALRLRFLGMQTDLSSMYGRLGTVDSRLDRIERRLQIVDAPAL